MSARSDGPIDRAAAGALAKIAAGRGAMADGLGDAAMEAQPLGLLGEAT
ncbi:hypothetical protein [Catellatospora tritici]|nr:hypothetical protein [Catellatospora tritici]MBV1853417.1 hypothetical protein [Catellatospora tritici]